MRIDPTGMDWFVNNNTGRIRFERGISEIENGDDQVWENIGDDDLYQDYTLENGTIISDIDNYSFSVTQSQDLMLSKANKVLVSQQDVEFTETSTFQPEVDGIRTVNGLHINIRSSKFTYKNIKDVNYWTQTKGTSSQNLFQGLAKKTTENVRIQNVIKLGEKPTHYNRSDITLRRKLNVGTATNIGVFIMKTLNIIINN